MSEECHTAIVGGTSLCLKKMQNMTFINKNMLSTSGLCQPFDEDGKQRQIRRIRGDKKICIMIKPVFRVSNLV